MKEKLCSPNSFKSQFQLKWQLALTVSAMLVRYVQNWRKNKSTVVLFMQDKDYYSSQFKLTSKLGWKKAATSNIL